MFSPGHVVHERFLLCPFEAIFVKQLVPLELAFVAVQGTAKTRLFGILNGLHERPKLLGYVLNTLNRAGGGGAGMAHSQAGSDFRLRQSIQPSLDPDEKKIIGDEPCLGAIPRLDVVARFLGERDKYSAMDFSKRTSGQPSVDMCITQLRTNLEKRIQQYNAKA